VQADVPDTSMDPRGIQHIGHRLQALLHRECRSRLHSSVFTKAMSESQGAHDTQRDGEELWLRPQRPQGHSYGM